MKICPRPNFETLQIHNIHTSSYIALSHSHTHFFSRVLTLILDLEGNLQVDIKNSKMSNLSDGVTFRVKMHPSLNPNNF